MLKEERSKTMHHVADAQRDSKLDLLVRHYESARDAEYERFVPTLGRPFLSAHAPGLTAEMDRVRTTQIRDHMRQWSSTWWEERGYCMVDLHDKNDGFTLRALQKDAG